MERMLRAGYAVFSWDNPGTGESTGMTTTRYRITQQQAQIVSGRDQGHERSLRHLPPNRIGLWGVSMGGYVMPRGTIMVEVTMSPS